MNPLVKKEIRLLLPSWTVAVLLALVQAVTRQNFYVTSLLFFGLTIMALTTVGREASLNTFSSLIALPAERSRIWETKLSVLAGAYLTVLLVWLAAFGIAFLHSNVDVSDRENSYNSYNLFITVCLLAAATFTGGLWTTLLLRQLAGAFWLTFLVPATLSGLSGAFLVGNRASDHLVIAVLSVVIGVYSLAGFRFARWLFFRAQDVGWSGGVIALPEWKFLSARAGSGMEVRKRQPIFALLKKELLLQQGVLTGAAGLLVLHASVIAFRVAHQFPKDSAGDGVGMILAGTVWVLWLVLPPLMGSIAVAEERKFGVMESQLCLPASRRVQFAIKIFMTLGLGVFLGGVMPMLLESIGLALGSPNPVFWSGIHRFDQARLGWCLYAVMVYSACTAMVGFFASSLAKSFLQAISIALVTAVGLMMSITLFNFEQRSLCAWIAPHSMLPLLVAVPTVVITLAWLAWLNFENFREGWPLWRRTLLGAVGAFVFIVAGSAASYHRAWEVFKPVEPAHGSAIFSLANPPEMLNEYENLLVRLPDGRVWFDYLSTRFPYDGLEFEQVLWRIINPLPRSAGPREFIAGSNWADASARHLDEQIETGKPGSRDTVHIIGYAESVGIQKDGTLWASGKSDPKKWTADHLIRFSEETNWLQLVRGYNPTSILLLKKDGSLWRWGTNHFDLGGWPQVWPGVRAFQPYQIGADSDWTGIYLLNGIRARKADGSVWLVWGQGKNGKDELIRATNYDQIASQKFSKGAYGNSGAYVRNDGTLWVFGQLHGNGRSQPAFEVLQSGRETDWVAVARKWDWMVAIKQDGTLWQWRTDDQEMLAAAFTAPPTRLGIHQDWISVVAVQAGVVALAADGSLWFWPNPSDYEYSESLFQLPKQPLFVGNVLSAAD